MKFGKWNWLATVAMMILPCVVIAAAVSLMMIITLFKLITHVDGLKMWNRLSRLSAILSIIIDAVLHQEGVMRDIKDDAGKCNMKII